MRIRVMLTIRRFILILGVLLWFVGQDEPMVFPYANSVRVSEVSVFSRVTRQVVPAMLVTVYEYGRPIYTADLRYVKAIRVGSEIR